MWSSAFCKPNPEVFSTVDVGAIKIRNLGGFDMGSFLVGVLVAVLIAVSAAVVLNGYVPDAASTAFSTQGVRI
jgi:hypothetical protein